MDLRLIPTLAASLGVSVLVMLPLTATAASEPRNKPQRGTSGLLIFPDSDIDIPSGLEDAYGLAQQLSEESPDDFGFPIFDSAQAQVFLPAVTSDARKFKEAVSSRQISQDTLDGILSEGGAERKTAPRPSDFVDILTTQVTFINGTESRRHTETKKDALFDLAIDPAISGSAGAWQSEVDPISGLVVLRVEELTADLASSIVARFGTDGVAIRVQKRPDSLPSGRDADISPFYGGAAINVPAGGCTPHFLGIAPAPA